MQWAKLKQKSGFTIVELLIVIVVIGILAAITIVAYNGVKNRAVTASVQSAVSQANKKIMSYAALNSDQYPATLADAGVTAPSGVSYQYTSDNTVTPKVFAVTASNGPAGSINFYVTNASSTPTAGIAPGHNLIVWDKTDNSTAPVVLDDHVTVDTSTFYTATASIKMAPNGVGRLLRNIPIAGSVGQTVTVSFWMKTDSTWNGTSNNSKIRIAGTDGTLLTACGYGGVATTWTRVTCSRAFTAANTSFLITVGNDGTTGNIWLDDISMSVK